MNEMLRGEIKIKQSESERLELSKNRINDK